MDHWWNEYVGTPWKPAARGRDGCDCGGLVCLVYAEQLKTDIGPKFDYDPLDPIESKDVINRGLEPFDQVQEPQDFDIVRLNIYSEPCHVGIVCDGGKSVLNIRAGVNAVIEPLRSGHWKNRIDSFWRLPA